MNTKTEIIKIEDEYIRIEKEFNDNRLSNVLYCEIKRLIVYFWTHGLLSTTEIDQYSKKYNLDLSKSKNIDINLLHFC